MDTALHVAGLLILFIACGAALFSLVLGLPGTFIIVGVALLYAWLTDFAAVQWSTIGWLTLLALIGEGVEFAASGAAAAGAGASTKPSWKVTLSALGGALVGGIIGTPLFFGLGSLLGALAGAFIGAALAVRSEGGTLDDSMAIGFAALKGRLFGFLLKTALAVVMVIVLAVAAL